MKRAMKRCPWWLALSVTFLVGCGDGSGTTGRDDPGVVSDRNPCLWPFAADSIWNTPIGSGAVYVPAGIAPATAAGMTYDPDFIVLTPSAPLVNLFESSVGFGNGDRCLPTGPALFMAPIPPDFVVPSDSGNACFAVLMPDGRTVRQGQPFARCAGGGIGTLNYESDANDLFTDGRLGPHGGGPRCPRSAALCGSESFGPASILLATS